MPVHPGTQRHNIYIYIYKYIYIYLVWVCIIFLWISNVLFAINLLLYLFNAQYLTLTFTISSTYLRLRIQNLSLCYRTHHRSGNLFNFTFIIFLMEDILEPPDNVLATCITKSSISIKWDPWDSDSIWKTSCYLVQRWVGFCDQWFLN